ncbi:hypothetical protein CY34DRAFT_805924 [Suillus luteus UH-Slu-Lm8-n1]|uniref:Uncharacterized protein n=1 Tax=Suillus luteus UH-Slu-Lm8-n1 TaxID=930992 RepID=A0A0D0AI94_9AGAM|nr:hypothetical protein CY34DRAFT_805924 [Suillus luteus UH-Slu-Lm8-n1]
MAVYRMARGEEITDVPTQPREEVSPGFGTISCYNLGSHVVGHMFNSMPRLPATRLRIDTHWILFLGHISHLDE